MSAFENATKFFHACENLQGWSGCKEFVAPGASFAAQCEPLVDVKSVEDYCDWMAGLGNGPLKGCGYRLNASSFDHVSQTAMFFGTLPRPTLQRVVLYRQRTKRPTPTMSMH